MYTFYTANFIFSNSVPVQVRRVIKVNTNIPIKFRFGSMPWLYTSLQTKTRIHQENSFSSIIVVVFFCIHY